MKKEKRGGSRHNSGRKKRDYPIQNIKFSVPIELVSDIKKLVKDFIKNNK